MKRSQAFASNYLGKDDVPGAVTAIIADVVVRPVKCEHGDENKPVMTFAHNQFKPLILNNVNWLVLEDAYGEDSDIWRGQPVEIYTDPNVMFGTRRVGGIRLRPSAVTRLTNGSVPSNSPPAAVAPPPAVAPVATKPDPAYVQDVAKSLEALKHSQSADNAEQWIRWALGIPGLLGADRTLLDAAYAAAKARLTRRFPAADAARRQPVSA